MGDKVVTRSDQIAPCDHGFSLAIITVANQLIRKGFITGLVGCI